MREIGAVLRIIGGVWLIFVSLIFAARVLGSAQPPPNGLQQLRLLDCKLPCWSGIIPGQTRFEDAARHVSAAFPEGLILGKDAIHAISSVGSSYGEIVITTKEGVVQYILIITTAVDGLTLGDIANLNGVSACSMERSPSVIAAYNAPGANALVVVNRDSPNRWRQSINNIDIRRSDQPAACVAPQRLE
jgi:hypothetical protein